MFRLMVARAERETDGDERLSKGMVAIGKISG